MFYQLFYTIPEGNLLQGRARLIKLCKGERFKLKTADGNHIDTMFIDRRNLHAHGDTLVICCEGNAGFYEYGTTSTPTEAGYSVLGWNHPGFGGSTVRHTGSLSYYILIVGIFRVCHIPLKNKML